MFIKKNVNDTTITVIEKLDKEYKMRELGRMMGYETYDNETQKVIEKLINYSSSKIGNKL